MFIKKESIQNVTDLVGISTLDVGLRENKDGLLVLSIWLVEVHTDLVNFLLFAVQTENDHRIGLFETGPDAEERTHQLVILDNWSDPVLASLQQIDLLAEDFGPRGFGDTIGISYDFKLVRHLFGAEFLIRGFPIDNSFRNLHNSIFEVCKLLTRYRNYRWLKKHLSLATQYLYTEDE